METFLVGLFFGIVLFGGLYVIMKEVWFPPTHKLRICKKYKGQYSYYRAEVYRPLYGWSPFYASKYNGEVWSTKSWSNDKSEAQNNIDTYKKLKNVVGYEEGYINQN